MVAALRLLMVVVGRFGGCDGKVLSRNIHSRSGWRVLLVGIYNKCPSGLVRNICRGKYVDTIARANYFCGCMIINPSEIGCIERARETISMSLESLP